jgi:hypothetical protein
MSQAVRRDKEQRHGKLKKRFISHSSPEMPR